MRVSIFVGDIADAPAEAVCTSTNPRLTLVMGTGASVRDRGGFSILRACEGIVEHHCRESGRRGLPAGSAHLTEAGQLPFKAVIHCVASDASHRTSPAIVSACVTSALSSAAEAGAESVAMPVFGSGHARLPFDEAIEAMGARLTSDSPEIREVVVVAGDREHAGTVRAVLTRVLGYEPQLAAVAQDPRS